MQLQHDESVPGIPRNTNLPAGLDLVKFFCRNVLVESSPAATAFRNAHRHIEQVLNSQILAGCSRPKHMVRRDIFTLHEQLDYRFVRFSNHSRYFPNNDHLQ